MSQNGFGTQRINLLLSPAADVAGADVIQLRVLRDFVAHCHWPKHLEKVLCSVNFGSKINALHVVRNDLK